MEIEFRKYDGSTTAINPRIEKRGEQFIMKLNEHNCEYFLLLSRTPAGKVDLNDSDIQNALAAIKNTLLEAQNERLTEEIFVSCINWSDYRANDYTIDLSARIAEYTVIACREEDSKLIVFIPDEDISCTARVSLTVSYRIYRVENEKKSWRPFVKEVPKQSFYVVEFDEIPNYRDGGIVYNFDGVLWDYPITAKMIENGKFYIDAECGMPKFFAKILGLELIQT